MRDRMIWIFATSPLAPASEARGVEIGEMPYQHLRETTMDPKTRTLLQVNIDDESSKHGCTPDAVADLGAKHAFLRAGLGWGHMPLHMVEGDLRDGTLVRIALETSPTLGAGFSMHAIHRKDLPPGPAGRWFVERLKDSRPGQS